MHTGIEQSRDMRPMVRFALEVLDWNRFAPSHDEPETRLAPCSGRCRHLLRGNIHLKWGTIYYFSLWVNHNRELEV